MLISVCCWITGEGTTEDEMVGWHHRSDGHEFKQVLGVGDGQGGLACCSPWGLEESGMTEWTDWTFHYMYLPIHSSFEGLLDFFQFEKNISKAALNICVCVFVWTKFSAHYHKYLGAWLLDHIIDYVWLFEKLPDCLPTWWYRFLHCHQQWMRIPVVHNLIRIWWCQFYGH